MLQLKEVVSFWKKWKKKISLFRMDRRESSDSYTEEEDEEDYVTEGDTQNIPRVSKFFHCCLAVFKMAFTQTHP